MKFRFCVLLLFLCFRMQLEAESLRVLIVAETEISPDRPEGLSVSLSYIDSVLIRLGGDTRFFRGIQLDLTAPAAFLAYPGHLASVIYSGLDSIPETGTADIEAAQETFEPLPNKLHNTWQIPLRASHNLRNSPYVTIPTDVIPPGSFPLLFRLMPVIKGISGEIERMAFQLHIKPILSDEGAVRLSFNYPEQLQGKPVTVLIDDVVIPDPEKEMLLKEGQHHIVILSDDYRNQSRRFLVERARTLDLLIELEDPTPLLIFESPEGALIYVDNQQVANAAKPYPLEPGIHEIRFQMSNYSITRPVTVQKGKTYRIALSVDVNITENE